jgi:hypothetical protein
VRYLGLSGRETLKVRLSAFDPKQTSWGEAVRQLTLPPLLLRRLTRSIPLVASRLLLGQDSGLACSLLGCGPRRLSRRFPFSLRCQFSGTNSLFGQIGFMRLLCGFTFDGANGSFCVHCFSRRTARCDRWIVRPWLGTEFLQHSLFRPRGIVLPLPKIRGLVALHSVTFSCSATGRMVRRRLDGSIEVTAQTILGLYPLAPAYNHGFDTRARYSVPPITAAPSTQEEDYIRPYMILAKNLKRLVRRRFPFMNEGVDALLPCCHPFF